jgi:hypothetical protein
VTGAASLEGSDQEAVMQKLAALGQPKNEAEMLQLLKQIPELASCSAARNKRASKPR